MCKNVSCLEYIYLQGGKESNLQKKLKSFVRIETALSIYTYKGQGKRPVKKVKKVL